MSIFHKYTVTQVLYYLLAIFIVGFLFLSAMGGWQVRKIMIHGPIYKQVTQGRNLIADILPPPGYIIESYLNVMELSNETDTTKIELLLAKGKKLEHEYLASHERWKKELSEGALAQVLLIDAYAPAVSFYKIRNKEFIPHVKAHGKMDERKKILAKMKLAYEQHRKEIDKAVIIAMQRNTEDESTGAASVSRGVWLMVSFNIIFLLFFTFLYVCMVKAEAANRAITAHVDELEQAKKELLNRTTQLETINKELESFSYSVSHDLRAPLRGIDGWSLALIEDYEDSLDEQGKVYLKRVRSETQRMGMLIDDLLKLAQFSRVEMSWNKVNISKLAEVVVKRLKEENPNRKIVFTIQEGLEVSGDGHFLEIVLTNLLSNACKFTGKVQVAEIEFGCELIDGKNAYYVRDNGAGFNMASAKNLFGTFERMHKQSDFSGTGIGLAIVKRIITLHQGRVWANAVLNQGAVFYFTIQEKALS